MLREDRYALGHRERVVKLSETAAETPSMPTTLRSLGERVDQAAELLEREREHEVLELVAAGMSNEQIAERLFLSTRTVERHLSNIYAKLRLSGKSARAAAAARFSRTR